MSGKHVLWIIASLMLAACDSTSGPSVPLAPDNPGGPVAPADPGDASGTCQISSQPASSRLSSLTARPCQNQPHRPVL
jgi:hypothetical protein